MRVMQQQEQIVRLIPVTNWSTVETEKQEGSVFFLLGARARQSLWTSAMVVNAFFSSSPSLSRFNPKLWVSLSNSEPNEGRDPPPSPPPFSFSPHLQNGPPDELSLQRPSLSPSSLRFQEASSAAFFPFCCRKRRRRKRE